MEAPSKKCSIRHAIDYDQVLREVTAGLVGTGGRFEDGTVKYIMPEDEGWVPEDKRLMGEEKGWMSEYGWRSEDKGWASEGRGWTSEHKGWNDQSNKSSGIEW